MGFRRSNRDQENLLLMRFSSIIYGRQKAKRWDTTDSNFVNSAILLYQHRADSKSFLFRCLPALPFSVSRKSFACHSYENSWVCTDNSHSEVVALHSRELPALSFQALANCPFRNSFPLIFIQNDGGLAEFSSTSGPRTFNLCVWHTCETGGGVCSC